MRWTFLLLLPAAALAQPRVDNVLVKMVPPNATSLVGARMGEIRQTAFFRELVSQRKMPQIDQFAKETGFDPRRDVREVLYVSTSSGGVLLARGTFRLNQAQRGGAKLIRHGAYNVWTSQDASFCVLDPTLAAAGDLKSVEAALDEWRSGGHTGAQALLNRMRSAEPGTQFWGVSTGFADFVADHLPNAGQGIDFSRIFRGLENTWFQTSLVSGFRGEVHGTAANEPDAVRLRDTVKGLVGYGRLSVPENQSEMLKFWDAITAEQQGRAVTVKADIPQNLMDRAVRMLSSAPPRP